MIFHYMLHFSTNALSICREVFIILKLQIKLVISFKVIIMMIITVKIILDEYETK